MAMDSDANAASADEEPSPQGEWDRVLDELEPLFLRDRERGEVELARYRELFPEHRDEVTDAVRRWIAAGEQETVRSGSSAPAGIGRSRVGCYQLLHELGRGGQASVWLAYDERVDRNVALKILHDVGPGSARGLDRFRREAQLTSRLDHPGICPIFDVGVDDVPYIAMRFVEGESLASIIDARREERGVSKRRDDTASTSRDAPRATTDVGVFIEIVEKVARALDVAHAVGVVHRDVKPGNVMIRPDGEPVLLDFGIASLEEDGLATLTRSGEVVGTPAYMAPEQVSGRADGLGPQTDVYALGATLFECLTLTRPFAAPTREGLFRAILEEPLPDPRRRNPAIDRDTATVIRCAMSRDPRRRYATAGAFADDLENLRLRRPIAARPPSVALKLRLWTRRNPALAISFALALLLFAAAMAGVIEALRAERRRVAADGDRVRALENEALSQQKYRQLADPAVLRYLMDTSDDLWPRRAETAEQMERWLDQAEDLLDGLDERRGELAALRASARPLGPGDDVREQRMRRRIWTDFFHDYDSASAAVAAWDRMLADPGLDEKTRARLTVNRDATAANVAEIAGCEELSSRVLYEFDSREDQRRHDALAELVRMAPRLETVRAYVETRLGEIDAIAQASLVDGAAAWRRCIVDVRDGGEYDGIELTPQVGLLPLGRDEDSGLWEFWFVESGERPRWAGEVLEGHVVPSERMGIVLVLLPGGDTMTGAQNGDPSAPHYDENATFDEMPPTAMRLAPFFLSKYETTQHQWGMVNTENPSRFAFDRKTTADRLPSRMHPVERVSWDAARRAAFRFGLVLPTEEQWEHAVRAGSGAPHPDELDGAAPAEVANVLVGRGDVPARSMTPRTAGSFPANALGLHDMVGNVSEWTRSRWGPYDYPPRPDDGFRHAPRSVPGWENRVWRGGHFKTERLSDLRSAARGRAVPDYRVETLGVRFARPVDR